MSKSGVNKSKSKTSQFDTPFYAYLLIVLFAFILYGNTIGHDYALDDVIYITENRFTQKGIAGIPDIFSYDSFKGHDENVLNAVAGGRYRPLSIATFAIEKQLLGNNPHFSHFFNILFYALTGILLFILLSKLLQKFPRTSWYLSIPFIATLLFLVHPVHTEVVANIKSRDEILSFLFSLLTLWLIVRYQDTERIIFLLSGAGSFFIALLSKEIAVVFVLVIPLSLYFFTSASYKVIARLAVMLLIVAAGFVLLRQFIISKTAAPADLVLQPGLLNDSFSQMNTSQKYATIAYTLGLYFKLLFFPHPLTWDYYPYHIPIMEWSNGIVLLSLILYCALIFFMIKGLRKRNFLSWSILLFIMPLLLTSNLFFPVGAFMAERFLYMPVLGFALVVAHVWWLSRVFSVLFFQSRYCFCFHCSCYFLSRQFPATVPGRILLLLFKQM